AQRPTDLSRDGAVRQPGLLFNRIGDLPGATLDHPERGVDQLVVLDAAAEGFRFHPGDDALARLEGGFGLHGPDHVRVVQVAIAEVEADQGVTHELALPHCAGVDVGQVGQQHRVQPTALAVHAAPRGRLLQGDLRPLRLVAGRYELVDLVG